MTTEFDTDQQKDLVRRLYETLYEEQAYDEIGAFYAPDAVRHGGLQGTLDGRGAIRSYLEATLGGMSDIEVRELQCVGEDDTVVYDFEMSGTHTGELAGVPATGNRIDTTNTALFRFEDGAVAEEWARSDMLGLLRSIGAVDLPL